MKAQTKIQQTAFMLVALTLFFVLVGMFVVGFKFAGLKETVTDLDAENVRLLVSKLANSPEFSCEESFGSKIYCIDADKVMMLKEDISSYENFWGVANIEIRKLYPEVSRETICTLANYPECNIIRIISDEVVGFDTSVFISLCRKDIKNNRFYDKCEIAKLLVSYEKIQ